MRIFLDVSSSWANKPLAGCSAKDRMSRILQSLLGCQTEPFTLGQGEMTEASLWINGLFPLWSVNDLQWALDVSPKVAAVWIYPVNRPAVGLLRLKPGLAAPSSLGRQALAAQYQQGFAAIEMEAPQWQLLAVASDFGSLSQALFLRNGEWAMASGALLSVPNQTWIEDGVVLAPDVWLGPGVYLGNGTRVESGVRIHLGCSLKNVTVASGAELRPYSVLEDCRIGADALVGPFAHIRSGSILGARTRVGNFVETKQMVLGDGSKASHLSYLGDAEIGQDCNIGAGTITCNYDGFNKWQTRLGDRVFIGSNSQLVAPVKIGDDAYVAAGSTITDDIPEDGLAIARSKQVIKEGRAKKLRARAKKAKT